MFQRFIGAIDRTLTEEQARQQQRATLDAQKQGGRRSRASSGTGTQSPARRSRPSKKAPEEANGDSTAVNPDPAVFEAAFVIDDDMDDSATPSRQSTPVSADKEAKSRGSVKDSTKDAEKSGGQAVDTAGTGPSESQPIADKEDTEQQSTKTATVTTPAVPPALSSEIQARLRKLDRLEKTYPELLRSYRIAHTRATSIEPFEKALRENTPLTSIKDPDALVEYLSQLNLKGDMVMTEFKRVSGENDTNKRKADVAEKELITLREEVAALRAAKTEATDTTDATTDETKSQAQAPNDSATTSVKSPVTRVLSVFSPKQKAAEIDDGVEGDEFFSYDKELPELQAEVEKKTEEIEKLQTEVQNLKEELSLSREQSSGLVENLENVTRELSDSRDAVAVKASIETQLEARKVEITSLTERLTKTQSQLKELEAQLEKEKSDAAAALREKVTKLDASVSQNEQLETEVKQITEAKSALDKKIGSLTSEIETLKKAKSEDEARIEELNKKIQSTPAPSAPAAVVEKTQDPSLAPPTTSSSKKKNKKKKKGGASAAATLEPTPSEVSAGDQPPPSPAEGSLSGELQAELIRLQHELTEKDQQIERLSKQRKTEEDLREEVENLQENLMLIGQNHVEAREKIKELQAEKKTLTERIQELEKEVESSASAAKGNTKLQGEYESLKQEFEDLNLKSSTLKSDLAAAQQLAQSRYKDLTDLREVLQKAQPELKSLRQESATLKTTREELTNKNAELRNLEKREKELKTELGRAQRIASDREGEIKSLQDKVTQETNARLRLEDERRVAGRDLRRSEAEKIELSAKEEKASRELQRVQDEAAKLRPRIKELEDEVARYKREQDVLREEAELKTNQYANAQILLGSMRDQTAELSIQLKESQSQCESLDEELAEARKMLTERTREAETMRRLLADVDERADSKVREMRAKMEAAVEERDRLEDESSALARKKTRETEELRQKIRDLEREVKALASEKDDLEQKEREWRRRREELEAYEERAGAEVNEMRSTVSNLRSTLDASEQQVRDTEKKTAELRRALDDYRLRYDKMAKEAKGLQAKLTAATTSPGSRSSLDSTRSGGVNGNGSGPSATPDAAYLKTILLQFLEQKDNKLRAQLVPVLGKLLKFDRADEQKWLAAIQHITSR